MNVTDYAPMTPYYSLFNFTFMSKDPIYSIILAYFIGLYAGIFVSLEYVGNYNNIIYGLMAPNNNEHEDKDDEDKDDEDKKETVNEDIANEVSDDDSDYVPDESDSESESDNDVDLEEIRDTINKLFVKTTKWSNFVSTKTIYTRIQALYPDVTKCIIKEAMNMEPTYITGSEHGKKGYRYMVAI